VTDGAGLFETGVYRRAARAALDSVTTERPRSVEALARGNRKRTAVVRFDDHPPVVLQVCTEQRWLRTESVLLGRIRGRTSVPVPPVLAAGTTGGVAFMITAYVPGDDLHERFAGLDSARQQALSREFGRYLGRLHGEFRFGGYGTIAVDDGQLVAQSDDWRRWFTEYGRAAIARLPSEFDPVRGGLQGLFAGQSRRRPPTPVCSPGTSDPGTRCLPTDR
jgi:Phosphotransferase enzyme family.